MCAVMAGMFAFVHSDCVPRLAWRSGYQFGARFHSVLDVDLLNISGPTSDLWEVLANRCTSWKQHEELSIGYAVRAPLPATSSAVELLGQSDQPGQPDVDHAPDEVVGRRVRSAEVCVVSSIRLVKARCSSNQSRAYTNLFCAYVRATSADAFRVGREHAPEHQSSETEVSGSSVLSESARCLSGLL